MYVLRMYTPPVKAMRTVNEDVQLNKSQRHDENSILGKSLQ